MATQQVTVRVPATTANLGPGFDCLGMALDLWNEVTLQVGKDTNVEVTGEGEESLARDESNLVVRAARMAYQEAGVAAPSFQVVCRNDVPLARGLGSSAAAAVGGLVAANALGSLGLTDGRLLDLAVEIEGHSDNVAPALLGGFRIVYQDGEGTQTSSVPFPDDLYAVLFIPDMEMATSEARAILPQMITRKDAVFNMARVGLLVHAIESGELELLKHATQDLLHQPQRQQVFRPMKYIFRGALAGGAMGVFLSGGGPTILAITRGRRLTIGYEMADAAYKLGCDGRVKIVKPVKQGAYVV
jgi:homoserine kinase